VDGQPAARTTPAGDTVSRLSLSGSPGFAAGYTRGALTERALDPDVPARALARGLGVPDAEVVRLVQVHGSRVLTFEEPPRTRRNALLGEADALLSNQPDVLLVVASADCVPVVLADPATGWIAAIHAGWRGTALRVVDAALDALEERGVRIAGLSAGFGPSVSRDRYEVGPEVVDALLEAYGAAPDGAVRAGANGKSFVDVAAFDEAALLARGLSPSRIHRPRVCNAAASDLPSWRRDGPGAGRILTGVVRLRA
jgi:YfiH family protein